MNASDPRLRLDHLAVAAETLADGVAWVEERLGVPMSPGGQHPAMGTHNRLLSLGPDVYLEVIAIDPEAPAPPYARWFGLDTFQGPPRLQAWIVALDDISHAPASAGRPVALARSGLHWQMAVPEDGQLPMGGLHPAFIAWGQGGHPTDRLPKCDVRLQALQITHPRATDLLDTVTGLSDPRVRIAQGPPGIAAVIDTPCGQVSL